VGAEGVEQEYIGEDDGTTEWVNRFYPRWIQPTPQMIDIPTRCPEIVSKPNPFKKHSRCTGHTPKHALDGSASAWKHCLVI
jgi:hypothetical protein